MNTYTKLHWTFWGAVAKMVEEDIDDTVDAVVFAAMTPTLAVAFWWTTIVTFRTAGTIGTVAGGFLALLSAGVTVLAPMSVAASAIYATQPTELPAGEEVTTRG